jgi:hypothetical protein
LSIKNNLRKNQVVFNASLFILTLWQAIAFGSNGWLTNRLQTDYAKDGIP